jgi:hypothetical protein
MGLTNQTVPTLYSRNVELNEKFSKSVQNEDENLQEIIQFEYLGPKETKIISSMIGWGQGDEWIKTYNFFCKGKYLDI